MIVCENVLSGRILRSCGLSLSLTQNWAERSCNPNDSDEGIEDCSLAEVKKSVELLTSHFRKPLEAKGVTIATIQDEIEDIDDYAQKYLTALCIERSGTNCNLVQMPLNGPTLLLSANWHSAYHFQMGELNRFFLL